MTADSSPLLKYDATRITATTIGVIFGIGGMNHGFFEFLQGNQPTPGLIIQAIGPEQRFWPLGTEEAFTIIPNFMITGLLAMLVGLVIIVWSLFFLDKPHGRAVFLGLFILLFLVGGGIGQVAFFIPSWAFATRIDKPLTRWAKTLPPSIRPALTWVWIVTLIGFVICILIGLEMAVFGRFPGLTDPTAIQNTTLLFVLAALIFSILSFIAGFGHNLRRMQAA